MAELMLYDQSCSDGRLHVGVFAFREEFPELESNKGDLISDILCRALCEIEVVLDGK